MNNEKTMTPVIVFDLGGVLIDWNPYYLFCNKMGLERQAAERILKEIDFSTWNKEQDRGRPYAEATPELCARFPQYSDLIRAYDERYLDTVGGSCEPVVDILGRLKNAGYSLFALSNWPAEKFALVRPRYPFLEWFDELVVSGEVKLVKPEPAIYRHLLERAARPAQECLFIDDHAPNIHTAVELGFQTILFESASQLEAELRRRGISVGAPKDERNRSGGNQP